MDSYYNHAILFSVVTIVNTQFVELSPNLWTFAKCTRGEYEALSNPHFRMHIFLSNFFAYIPHILMTCFPPFFHLFSVVIINHYLLIVFIFCLFFSIPFFLFFFLFSFFFSFFQSFFALFCDGGSWICKFHVPIFPPLVL